MAYDENGNYYTDTKDLEHNTRAVPRLEQPLNPSYTAEEYLQKIGVNKVDTDRKAVPQFPVGGGDALAGVYNDPVNSPSHYTSGGIETIDFIEAKRLNYNLGNAVKYISRAGKKVTEVPDRASFGEAISPQINEQAQDLEKAIWYLQREIINLKKA